VTQNHLAFLAAFGLEAFFGAFFEIFLVFGAFAFLTFGTLAFGAFAFLVALAGDLAGDEVAATGAGVVAAGAAGAGVLAFVAFGLAVLTGLLLGADFDADLF
jgi:hypothetical protein